ncbi:MAG: hypothetical protein QOJ65_932 [Fimbriimonadaceae bacterium]|jgi:hypothetical protein|nr:hypothetical protein [Fimbriimonadaceae bacterium]
MQVKGACITLLLLAAAFTGSEQPADRIHGLEATAKRTNMAANWRALADASVEAGMYPKASEAFANAAALYEKSGDPNAAKVLQTQANRYDTYVRIYYDRTADDAALQKNYTAEKFEPVYGCYTGAFIDREDVLENSYVANDQTHREAEDFDAAVGKKQAIYFMYLKYGRPFPTEWAKHLYQARAAAHIVWEPSSLDEVQDDQYLRGFARDCWRSGVPVFLRYAGEMNGDWVPYGADPAAYIEKFRLVARIIRQYAPNVAMVWCPNEIPESKIEQFFPGDDAVDWVGVNFYSVTFSDADINRPVEWVNPADKLRFIYSKYSAKHPIMIGEYAATHHSVVDKLPRPDFAQTKIAQLYSALPRIYPRVKAVNWLSMNTLKYALAGRQLNDYSLLDTPRVAASYGRAVKPLYFLPSVPWSIAPVAPIEIAELKPGSVVGKTVHLTAYVKSYDQHPSVQWIVDGKPVYTTDVAGAYDLDLDTSPYSGEVKVVVQVKDEKGQLAGNAETSFRVPG